MQRDERIVAVLRESCTRLFEATSELTADELEQQSYCSEWSVAEVLSHIGSGAEIFRRWIEAAQSGGEVDRHDMEAVWSRWNALDALSQASAASRACDELLFLLEGLGPDELASLRLSLPGGMTLPGPQALEMVLFENALHSWDVAVSFEPSARVRPEAVELLIDSLGATIARWAEPADYDGPSRIAVALAEPRRHFVLVVGEAVELEAGEGDADARIAAAAEAFLRLVAGRLDKEHTPLGFATEGVGLEELRRLFPGR